LHAKLWHVVPPGQTLSHWPQWSLLEAMSVHAPVDAQKACDDEGHLHTLFWQIWPALQAFPHEPQWLALLLKSTHALARAQNV
jgi:hypothetical protein